MNALSPANGPAVTVSIVIVSYCCKQLVRDSLRSLYDTAPGTRFEVIVVDNASNDDTVAALNAEFPQVRTVALKENVGFGRGCNAGAAQARGEYVLLLNPDTIVLPGAIDNLVRLAADFPAAGIWGGRTVGVDGARQLGSCWRFPTLWSTFCVSTGLCHAFRDSRLFNREAYGGEPWDGVRQVDVVSGCLLLIRRSLWNALGGFDPIYFMYSEEVDLCVRAHALGARPLVSSEVQIIHLAGKTQPVRADRLVRLLKGKRTYMLRHWPRLRERVGAALLLSWPASRYYLLRIIGVVRPSARLAEAAGTWGDVWRRRREWLPGWAPVAAMPARPSAVVAPVATE